MYLKRKKVLGLIGGLSLMSLGQVSNAVEADAYGRLLHAVQTGDHEAVSSQLTGLQEPDRRLPDGSTLLAWAADTQDSELVRLLLDAGADPNAEVNPASTPLLVACQYGDTETISLLLDAGADVNASHPVGMSVLAVCAGNASAEMVERLIASGASVNKADSHGQTPLMWAASAGRMENMRVLIDHGAHIDSVTEKGFTPLFFALKSHNPEAPFALMKAGADLDHVSANGTTVIQLAMYQDAYDFAAWMIENGKADLSAFDLNGNQLLHEAILAQQTGLVDLLVAKGADVNQKTGPSQVKWRYEGNFRSDTYVAVPKSPLLLAVESGDTGIMDSLIAGGAAPAESEGVNVLMAAASSGSPQMLSLVLSFSPEVDVTAEDYNGQTPLHVVVGLTPSEEAGGVSASAIAEMMQLLADRGASYDIRNGRDLTALDLLARERTPPEVKEAFAKAFGVPGL